MSPVSIDEVLGGINVSVMGGLAKKAIKDSLATAGDIKALYMELQKVLLDNNHERWWFLTERYLVRIEITSAAVVIRNYQLNTIAHVEREYDISNGRGGGQHALKTVRIRFIGRLGDLIIARPFESENGDVYNFAHLFQLL